MGLISGSVSFKQLFMVKWFGSIGPLWINLISLHHSLPLHTTFSMLFSNPCLWPGRFLATFALSEINWDARASLWSTSFQILRDLISLVQLVCHSTGVNLLFVLFRVWFPRHMHFIRPNRTLWAILLPFNSTFYDFNVQLVVHVPGVHEWFYALIPSRIRTLAIQVILHLLHPLVSSSQFKIYFLFFFLTCRTVIFYFTFLSFSFVQWTSVFKIDSNVALKSLLWFTTAVI